MRSVDTNASLKRLTSSSCWINCCSVSCCSSESWQGTVATLFTTVVISCFTNWGKNDLLRKFNTLLVHLFCIYICPLVPGFGSWARHFRSEYTLFHQNFKEPRCALDDREKPKTYQKSERWPPVWTLKAFSPPTIPRVKKGGRCVNQLLLLIKPKSWSRHFWSETETSRRFGFPRGKIMCCLTPPYSWWEFALRTVHSSSGSLSLK